MNAIAVHEPVVRSTYPVPQAAGIFSEPAVASAERHLLALEGLGAATLNEILDEAARFRDRWRTEGKAPGIELRGFEVCNAFFEDSTRTRVSFEIAAQRLGATHTTFGVGGSSVSKGESLLDTIHTIAAMGVDLFVIRHPAPGSAAYVARHLGVGVINGGDGMHEHPTQGLLDLLTLRDAWNGRFEGRRLAIVGDIAHSRVARSAIHGLTALGTEVTLAGPATLMPADVELLGVSVAPTLDDAMAGADGVMALRLQRERMEAGKLPSLPEYTRNWGVNSVRVSTMKPEAVVMHPGPMNRGVEIAPDAADGPRSRVFGQVENGVAVRSAVLARCARAAQTLRTGRAA
ncbi:MAG: aspartate carbamoyltransferase catalytic subunit [Candidatus Eisenbacteria bacterium]